MAKIILARLSNDEMFPYEYIDAVAEVNEHVVLKVPQGLSAGTYTIHVEVMWS